MRDGKRDTDVKNRLLDSVGEGEGGMICENNIETCILSYVKQTPVQVQCMRQSSWGWCTEMTEGWMGSDVGGGFRMGNTCTPADDSRHCMAKTITIL